MRFSPKQLLPLSCLALAQPLTALAQAPACIPALPPYANFYTTPSVLVPGRPFNVNVAICPALSSPATLQLSVSWHYGSSASASTTITAASTGTGTVAGLPAGPYNINVTGITNGPNSSYSANLPLTITVGAGQFAPALKGSYAFLVRGTTDSSAPGAASATYVVGTFTADGAGNITGGTADFNGPQGSATAVPITGYYSLLPSGLSGGSGAIELDSQFGPLYLAVNLPAFYNADEPAYLLSNSDVVATGQVYGNGSIALQTPAQFQTSSGPLSNTLSGETPCDLTCAAGGGQALPIAVQGSSAFLSFSPANPSQSAWSLGGTTTIGATVANSLGGLGGPIVSTPGVPSRFVLNNLSPLSPTPAAYVLYQIDAVHSYVMSLDPHTSAPLLGGVLTYIAPPSK